MSYKHQLSTGQPIPYSCQSSHDVNVNEDLEITYHKKTFAVHAALRVGPRGFLALCLPNAKPQMQIICVHSQRKNLNMNKSNSYHRTVTDNKNSSFSCYWYCCCLAFLSHSFCLTFSAAHTSILGLLTLCLTLDYCHSNLNPTFKVSLLQQHIFSYNVFTGARAGQPATYMRS